MYQLEKMSIYEIYFKHTMTHRGTTVKKYGYKKYQIAFKIHEVMNKWDIYTDWKDILKNVKK